MYPSMCVTTHDHHSYMILYVRMDRCLCRVGIPIVRYVHTLDHHVSMITYVVRMHVWVCVYVAQATLHRYMYIH